MLRYLLYTVIAIIIILIIVSAILRKRIYKEVDRLDEWKNDILMRPIPDEIGKIKKLQMSGQTEMKFEDWRQEWDDIVGNILPNIEERLFDIEDLVAKYRYKKANELVDMTEKRLHSIEEQLTMMLKEIDELVQSEKQNRTEISEVKVAYKQLSTQLMKKRGILGIGLKAFDERIKKMDDFLQSFEQDTKEGSYLKAREKLIAVSELIDETSILLQRFPQLLVQWETTIPNEISELRKGIAEMENAGFELSSFNLSTRLHALSEKLEPIKEQFTSLNCAKAEKSLNEITAEIEEIYDLLEYEVQSKQFVQSKLATLNDQVEKVNEYIVALSEEATEVKQSYHLPKERTEAQDEMKESVVTLTKELRVLKDVVSEEKITFTSIREMVESWEEKMDKLAAIVQDEKKSLRSLREDEWKAKETLQSLRETLLNTKRSLQKSNIPGLPERSLLQLELADEKMRAAEAQLEEVPLELGRVTVLVDEAVVTVTENEQMVKETIRQASLAEIVIQFGNRYRSRSAAVDEALTEAEIYFRQCEYEMALRYAVEATETYDPAILERAEQFINT